MLDSAPVRSAYERYCRPQLVQLLRTLDLDAVYERAEGDRLWMRHDGELVEVLDFVGGYGANFFGHHHLGIASEARRLLDAKVPVLAQGSCRSNAAMLGKRLSEMLGEDYVAIFTNSGAEAVEAAIKHACLESRRPVLWAVRGAFHGKTLGAIQLTWSFRHPFSEWGPQVRFLDPDDPSDWERAKSEADGRVAAAFVEPILGEGGLRLLPPAFVAWLNENCKELGVPLVVDEIQTGMGRTGSFLASGPMGLDHDYVCLSKSLGGGLSKIGVVLIKRSRFVDEFALMQTSTFAEDDWSCGLALKALEILEKDKLPARCEVMGDRLLSGLEEVRKRFPRHIKDLRGKGLMVGIELAEQSASPSNILKIFSQQRYLGWMAAAYLLNVHKVRVAPTLSAPFTLRVQPSAYVSETHVDRFVTAIGSLCEALEAADVPHLTVFDNVRPSGPIRDYRLLAPSRQEHPRTPRQVAFIGHLISPEHAALVDPSLGILAPSDQQAFLAKVAPVAGPAILDRVNVLSQTGDEVHLNFIGLPLTSQQIVRYREQGQLGQVTEKIEAAVALARDTGCQVVGLGGYTSSVTSGCLRVRTKGIALTSGNALTVGMGVRALDKAAAEAGIELSAARLAVLGVPGNIASTYAVMMASCVSQLVLVVRDPASTRLKAVIREIQRTSPATSLEISSNLQAVSTCSLVVTATSSGGSLLQPEHFGPGPVIVCDISVPPDVAPSVSIQRPDVLVLEGGVVRLPENDDFAIAGIPLEKGFAFACMSETLLMGLEGRTSHGSYGSISPGDVEEALAMADKHGFTLGRFKRERSY